MRPAPLLSERRAMSAARDCAFSFNPRGPAEMSCTRTDIDTGRANCQKGRHREQSVIICLVLLNSLSDSKNIVVSVLEGIIISYNRCIRARWENACSSRQSLCGKDMFYVVESKHIALELADSSCRHSASTRACGKRCHQSVSQFNINITAYLHRARQLRLYVHQYHQRVAYSLCPRAAVAAA